MTAKQLTDSILQMAIQGKLVPQDPNDEPASALLGRIREEKRRLVKEGKLKKKDLIETPVEESEQPFKIPESWEWVRFGDFVSTFTGKTPPRGESVYWGDNDYPWVSISDMKQGEIIYTTKESVSQRAADNCFHGQISHKGTLIMSFKLTVGRTSILGIDAYHNEAIISINTYADDNHYIRDYLSYLLPIVANTGDSKDAIKGKTLNSESIYNLFIPLPPLAEQHRIVEKIEKLLPIINEYGEAYEEASKMDAELPDKLKKSILQEAIMGKLDTQDPNDEPASVLLEHIREEKKRLVKEGKLKKKDLIETSVEESEQPFKIPESWEWCRVEDYANKVTDFVASGSFATLRENVKYYKEENYALLVKTKDFQTNFNRDLTFTDKHGYEFLANSNLFGGELILSNVGSIGKIFIVPKLNRKMSLAPNAIMVRFWNEEHRDWLYYLFQSPFGLALLYEISSATAIRKFNKTDFKKLIIPLPPLAEQHRIVEKIEALFSEIDNMTINDITTKEEETKETETE